MIGGSDLYQQATSLVARRLFHPEVVWVEDVVNNAGRRPPVCHVPYRVLRVPSSLIGTGHVVAVRQKAGSPWVEAHALAVDAGNYANLALFRCPGVRVDGDKLLPKKSTERSGIVSSHADMVFRKGPNRRDFKAWYVSGVPVPEVLFPPVDGGWDLQNGGAVHWMHDTAVFYADVMGWEWADVA